MRRLAHGGILSFWLVLTGCACGPVTASLDTVTTQGAAINDLFIVELGLSAVLFAIVAGILCVSIVRFRARATRTEPPQTEGNQRLEVLWTVLPAALLAVIFVFVIRTITAVNASAADAITVDVIGHQWWWEFRFPDQQAVTANELHLPVETPIVLRLTSDDVIHSFAVPQLGWMRDAIPGRTNRMPVLLTQSADMVGGCNQYCGIQHAWMRERVIAESSEQFTAWLTQQAADAPLTGARGEQVFVSTTCVNCHTIRGLARQGTVGPDLTHVGSRTTLAGGILSNTPTNLALWIRDAQAYKPGALMPGFTSMSDADVAALADYLSGLK